MISLFDLLSAIGTTTSIISELMKAKELYEDKAIAPVIPDYSMIPDDLEPFAEAVDDYLSAINHSPILTPDERGAVRREFYKQYPELYYNRVFSNQLMDRALDDIEIRLKERMSAGEQVIKRQLDSLGAEVRSIYEKIDVLLQSNSDNKALRDYYENKRQEFETPHKDSTIIGGSSLNDTYIDIDVNKTKNGAYSATDFIIDWCKNYSYGALVLYGEPGHGKTTLGLKLVHDYIVGNIGFKVLCFPLVSPFGSIVNGDKLHIYDSLILDMYNSDSKLDDNLIENSLIILDGYDELQATLPADNPYTDFISFFKAIDGFAQDKKAHILITTRSMTISILEKEDISYLRKPSNRIVKMELMTEELQINWVKEHKPEYLSKFLHLRQRYFEAKSPTGKKDDILGIPFIFLMVVEAEFDDDADNLVELFDKLFDVTFRRKNPLITQSGINRERERYEYLAYLMYRDRGKYAEVSDGVDFGEYSLYTFSYYTKLFQGDKEAFKKNSDRGDSTYNEEDGAEKIDTVDVTDVAEQPEYKRFIEFYHRIFYEYFLSYYLYEQFNKVSEDNVDDFLYSLGEWSIDFYVLKYIKQIIQNKGTGYNIIVQDRLERTNAIIIGDDSDPLQRANTIFVNAIMLMNVFAGGLVIHEKPTETFSTYEDTKLCNLFRRYKNRRIDLSGCKMTGAHIDRADFRKSHFDDVDMTGKADFSMSFFNSCSFKGANMQGIEMYRTILDGCSLISTNMTDGRFEEASFKKARIEKANLSGANLKRANFSGARLIDVIVDENTDFEGAVFDGTVTNCDLSVCIKKFSEFVDCGKIKYKNA